MDAPNLEPRDKTVNPVTAAAALASTAPVGAISDSGKDSRIGMTNGGHIRLRRAGDHSRGRRQSAVHIEFERQAVVSRHDVGASISA